MVALLDRLTTPHRPGELLQALNPRWGARLAGGNMQGTIESVIPMSIDAAVVRIRTPRGWPAHRPGQFVVLGVDVDGVRHRRSFTITSLADPSVSRTGEIEITVQAGETGLVSRHLVAEACVGDVVQLCEPAGQFCPPTDGEPLLLLSGGSGITPFVATLRAMAVDHTTVPDATGRNGARPRRGADVVLVHRARSTEALLHRDELHALAAAMPWLRLEIVLTRDSDGNSVPGTHLSPATLDEGCPDWRLRTTYVCGPAEMLDFAREHWALEGLAARLETEAFSAPAPRPPASESGGPFEVAFDRTGGRSCADGSTSLLEVAEAEGLAPRSGCRMGICHSCSTAVSNGRARDLRTGSLVEAGRHVQLCVSAAASDICVDL